MNCPVQGSSQADDASDDSVMFDMAHRGGSSMTPVGRWRRPVTEGNSTVD